MAQSRVQKGKGKKSKFPMWGLGIIVVLVVVIAGYAIVRFSKAGGSGGSSLSLTAKDFTGGNGAYKTKITKSTGGGTVDAWALPKGAYVNTSFGLSSPYATSRADFCATMQRNNGATGSASMGVFPRPAMGGIATVSVTSYKNYCISQVGAGFGIVDINSWYQVGTSITNNTSSILYVTTMSLVW